MPKKIALPRLNEQDARKLANEQCRLLTERLRTCPPSEIAGVSGMILGWVKLIAKIEGWGKRPKRRSKGDE